jgi:hypothetical protein
MRVQPALSTRRHGGIRHGFWRRGGPWAPEMNRRLPLHESPIEKRIERIWCILSLLVGSSLARNRTRARLRRPNESGELRQSLLRLAGNARGVRFWSGGGVGHSRAAMAPRAERTFMSFECESRLEPAAVASIGREAFPLTNAQKEMPGLPSCGQIAACTGAGACGRGLARHAEPELPSPHPADPVEHGLCKTKSRKHA